MPPRQKSLTRGRWRAFALSFLLHSAIVATAVLAWKYWKHKPEPIETVAIQGTLVDESTLKGAKPAPAPEPTPPPPEPEPVPTPEPEDVGPPKPDPADIERIEAEKKQAQEKAEQEKREAQQKEQERVEAEKKEADRVEAEKQAAAEKKRLDAEKQAAADKKKADDAAARKRAADDAAAKKAAAEKARQAQEAELRKSLEAEERGRALQNSDEAARWHAQIVAKIQRAWIKPPSAQPGISCTVLVTQVPGGEVTSVRVDSCNGGDAALRESVERAVYNASPLPSPPDPALFERNLELTFAPTS